MDYIIVITVAVTCGALISWKLVNWVWIHPKQMERRLRQMGFNGNSYRFLVGDSTDINAKSKLAQSKPIPFNNQILERLLPFILQTIQKHGENCFMWFGQKATIMISNPEMIKEILSKNYIFQKPHSYIEKLIAEGVAMYETQRWTKHRRILNPAFHLDKLKSMVPSFYASSVEMVKKWEEIRDGNEVDVWPYLQTLTSDAISRTAFGSNYEEGRKIFELQQELGALILQAIEKLFIPGWRFVPTKSNGRMKKIAREIETSIQGIIKKRMKEIETNSSDDLLGILLESNLKEIQQNGDESGINFREVVEECKLFYLAGQMTTSSLLVWTMILLAKHTDWQDRARQEVLQICSSEIPQSHELNHLKVMSMIFNEVLRLYPPAPMLSRTIHEDTTLGNIILPAGVQIFLPLILLHHDDKLWGDDVKDFNPERFNEGVSKATNGRSIYFPFGGGPRICIGQNFAMLEAKMAMAIILRKYSFEVSPSYEHAPETIFSLQPQYGAQLILHKI